MRDHRRRRARWQISRNRHQPFGLRAGGAGIMRYRFAWNDSQWISSLGDGAERRSRIFRGRPLLDRNRRGEPFDRVDVGPFHLLEELPCAGRRSSASQTGGTAQSNAPAAILPSLAKPASVSNAARRSMPSPPMKIRSAPPSVDAKPLGRQTLGVALGARASVVGSVPVALGARASVVGSVP
jgi:hypothetical protein